MIVLTGEEKCDKMLTSIFINIYLYVFLKAYFSQLDIKSNFGYFMRDIKK